VKTLALTFLLASSIYAHPHGEHGEHGEWGGMRKHHGGRHHGGPLHHIVEQCSEELLNICPDIESPKDYGICMKNHRDELSEDCTNAIREAHHHQPPPEVVAACKDDKEKLCPNKEGRRAKRCMMHHRDELSDKCKDAIKAAHQPPPEVVAACKDDKEKLCPNKEGWHAKRCMMHHRNELSDKCKDAIKAAHHPTSPADEVITPESEAEMSNLVSQAFEVDEHEQEHHHHHHRFHRILKFFVLVVVVLIVVKLVVRRAVRKVIRHRRHRRGNASADPVPSAPDAYVVMEDDDDTEGDGRIVTGTPIV